MSRPKSAYNVEVRSPFPAPSLYMLYDWSLPAWRMIASDDTPKERADYIDFQLRLMSNPGVKTWGVYRDGELGGFVSATRFPARPWIAQPHCIFKRDFFGKATTTIACRKIFEELFEDGVLKIEMWVFPDNHMIRGLIGQFHARAEGTLTAQVMREGAPSDMMVFGLYPNNLTGE